MPKNTLQLEERDVLTLADLVSEALDEATDAPAFHQRSLIRLAVKVHGLAGKDDWPRVQVLNHAPAWVFEYLSRPLFPEGIPTEAAPKAKKRPKPKPPAEG